MTHFCWELNAIKEYQEYYQWLTQGRLSSFLPLSKNELWLADFKKGYVKWHHKKTHLKTNSFFSRFKQPSKTFGQKLSTKFLRATMKTRRLGGAKSDDSETKPQSKSKSRSKDRRCKRSNSKNRKSSAKSVSVSRKKSDPVSIQIAESESDRLVAASATTSTEKVGEGGSRWIGDSKCGSTDEVVSSTSDPGQQTVSIIFLFLFILQYSLSYH
jgi:hypothetical protein